MCFFKIFDFLVNGLTVSSCSFLRDAELGCTFRMTENVFNENIFGINSFFQKACKVLLDLKAFSLILKTHPNELAVYVSCG